MKHVAGPVFKLATSGLKIQHAAYCATGVLLNWKCSHIYVTLYVCCSFTVIRHSELVFASHIFSATMYVGFKIIAVNTCEY